MGSTLTSQHHFAPLLVAVTAGAIAWFIAHRLHINQRVQASAGRLEGFAGWLVFLAALQWLAVLHTFSDFAIALGRYAQQSPATEGPAAQSGLLAAVGVQGLLFVVVLGSAILMHRKSRRFPPLFRIELALLVLFPVAVGLLMTWESEQGQVPPQLALAFWIRAALFAPAAGIGLVYSFRSVRFRNTFVR